jgi:hypothetical protein
MLIPAVVVSYTISYRPSYLDTSVEVPPTSNLFMSFLVSAKQEYRVRVQGTDPMTGEGFSLSQLVSAYPTTPPAGPERILFSPEKFCKGCARQIQQERDQPLVKIRPFGREPDSNAHPGRKAHHRCP